MTNRRDVLRSGITLPALTLAAGPFAKLSAANEATVLKLERFVFDVRFAEPGAVAQHVERLGIPLAPIADDLMTLWYDDLDLRWREAPMALAGVTMYETLFVLETFALDRGMHVVFRGEHGLVEAGRITHRLAGPASMLRQFSPLAAPWEEALALAFAQCPLGTPAAASVELVSEGGALSLRDVPLYSWIIAPRAAVASMIRS